MKRANTYMQNVTLTADLLSALRMFAALEEAKQKEVLQTVGATLLPAPRDFVRIVRDVSTRGWYKRCAECRQPKAPQEFYFDRSKPQGKMYSCIACVTERRRKRSDAQVDRRGAA
jgi:hypothetical protein